MQVLRSFHEFSPVLRRLLLHEHHFDVAQWEERLGELLRPTPSAPAASQNDLFD